MFEKLDNVEIIKFFEESKSVSDFCNKVGLKSVNGHTIKRARELLLKQGLRYKSAKEIYLENPKECLYCKKKIPFEKRNNTFCGNSCSATFSNLKRKVSEEQKTKTSKTLLDRNEKIKREQGWIKKGSKWGKIEDGKWVLLGKKHLENCIICGKDINKKNKTKLCIQCFRYSKYGKSISSKKAKKLMEEGKIKSWASRNTLSYPEEFWLSVLENNSIYIDKPNKYFKPYFLDFWINKGETKIDLEIDGKQHNLKERKESDKKRDTYLKKNGFVVYRVKWNEINSEKGKSKMKKKINKFLEFYNDL